MKKKAMSAASAKKSIKGRVALCLFFSLFCAFVAWITIRNRSRNQEKSIASAFESFGTIDATKSRYTDAWWLRSDPGVNMETFYLLEGKKDKVLRLIEQSKDISSDTARLYDRFRGIKPGIFVPPAGGSTGIIRYLNINGQSGVPKGNEIGLCFSPEDATMKSLRYMPQWHPDENLISLPAVEIPDKILTGIMYHELGHAFLWNRSTGKSSTERNPVDSAENVLEEIEMHKLAYVVMDSLVGGRYSKFVDKIARRNLAEKRFDKAIASIASDEKDELYALFEAQKSEVGRGLLGSQCALLIGFRICKLRKEGSEGEIAVYRRRSPN